MSTGVPAGQVSTDCHRAAKATGIRVSPQDGERIIRLAAAQAGSEVNAATPLVAAELPLTGERFQGLLPPVVSAPTFAIRKRAARVIPLSSYVDEGVMTPWQGTRLNGEYDSQVAFGQRRVLLVWNRMILPDISSMTLDRLSGIDAAGNAGLADGVDRHWSQLIATAALSTVIGIGAELAAPDRGSPNQVIVSARQSTQDSINQVGQELTRHNANVQPTLTVRPGYPARVIVSKDLVLRPYRSTVQSSIDGAPTP